MHFISAKPQSRTKRLLLSFDRGGFFRWASSLPSSILDLSEGEKNRNALLSISVKLERADGVFLKMEANEELLERLKSVKNIYSERIGEITINERARSQYMESLYLQYMDVVQDLEKEMTAVQSFVKKLENIHEKLVLETRELIQRVRNCEEIVVRGENEYHLLELYCYPDYEYSNALVPLKMIRINTRWLTNEELRNIIMRVSRSRRSFCLHFQLRRGRAPLF